MLTPKCVLSFPHLITPSGFGDGPKTYNAVLLIDKAGQSTPQYKAMKDACVTAAKAKWGDKVNMKSLRNPFRDGNEKDYAGYADCVYISVKSNQKPGLVDENVSPLLDLDRIFPGANVIADVNVGTYDQGGNKGVAFYLQHMQFLKGGERLDGKSSATSVFSPEGGSDDEDAPF
jgi:hypothetical protein